MASMTPPEKPIEHLSGQEKRRLKLEAFGHNLSSKILTVEGNLADTAHDIPDKIIHSFKRHEEDDRNSYWKDKRHIPNFGEQMDDWRKGVTKWVTEQTDEKVIAVLEGIGLRAKDGEEGVDVTQGPVGKLLGVVNDKLAEVGGRIGPESLSPAEAKVLEFYTKYLGAEATDSSLKSLINAIVDNAKAAKNTVESENLKKTLDTLKKLEPIFLLAGEGGEVAMAALVVTKVYAAFQDEKEKIKHADPKAVLNEEENRAWNFIKRFLDRDNHPQANGSADNSVGDDGEEQEPLDREKSYKIEQVFAELRPGPTPGHKYWVENVPTNFTEELSKEKLKELEVKVPRTILEGENLALNPDGPALMDYSVFEKDKRAENALKKTNSLLAAVSAASASSPEQQSQMLQEIGWTILKAHIENPNLLNEFFSAQQNEYISYLGEAEHDLVSSQMAQSVESEKFKKEFEKKFHKPFDFRNLNQEQEGYFNKWNEEVGIPEIIKALKNISSSPERRFVVDVKQVKTNGTEENVPEINIPETVSEWKKRTTILAEAFSKDPFKLSMRQLSEIEFLSQCIDLPKVIQLMKQMNSAVAVDQQPQPGLSDGQTADGPMTQANPGPTEQSGGVAGMTPPLPSTGNDRGSLAPIAPAVPFATNGPLAQGAEPSPEAEPVIPAVQAGDRRSGPESQPESEAQVENKNFRLVDMFRGVNAFGFPHEANKAYLVDDPSQLDSIAIRTDQFRRLYTDGAIKSGLLRFKIFNIEHDKDDYSIRNYGLNQSDPFYGSLLAQNTHTQSANSFYAHMIQQKDPENALWDSTIFAFASDAASTPEKQAEVFVKLAKQVITFYKSGPQEEGEYGAYARLPLYKYFLSIKFLSKEELDTMLHPNPKQTQAYDQQLKDLEGRIESGMWTTGDLQFVSLLALPFDFEKLVEVMKDPDFRVGQNMRQGQVQQPEVAPEPDESENTPQSA